MKKIILITIVVLILIVAGITVLVLDTGRGGDIEVSNFEECAASGYPVMESYPEQCRTPDGQLFIRDIQATSTPSNLLRVFEPSPNAEIESPVTVRGEARGQWFFEASFPLYVVNANGERIGEGYAEAEGEWMTTEFVPFVGTVVVTNPVTTTGTLVLEKANPSGLPEHASEIQIPVRFDVEFPNTPQAECRPTGCSRQICADIDVITTCEYREEYACYQSAVCERQSDGECGWTETLELEACLTGV